MMFCTVELLKQALRPWPCHCPHVGEATALATSRGREKRTDRSMFVYGEINLSGDRSNARVL